MFYLFNTLFKFILSFTLLFRGSHGSIDTYGKAVLITGCDSGFGNQLAQRLNNMGIKVFAGVLNPNSESVLELTRNDAFRVNRFVKNITILQMDVTKDSDVNQVHEKVKMELSRSKTVLWAVVNSADISSYSPLEWGTLDRYKSVFEVNVFGAVRVTRTFLPLIRASRGRIVNVLNLLSRFSAKSFGIYSMSKHSLLSFSDVLRQEVRQFGVKVVTIEPGLTQSAERTEQVLEDALHTHFNTSTPEVKEAYRSADTAIELTQTLFGSSFVSHDQYGVVEDMVSSIINLTPQANYRRIGTVYKFILFFHLFFPVEFVNWTMNTIERFAITFF